MAPRTKAQPTGQLNKWEKELAEFATQAAASEQNTGGSQFISTKGGQFTVNGGTIPGGKMRVVVVDFAYENCFYTGKFDPANPSSPDCFAFGRNEEEMVPHPQSADPQCASCKDCPHNKFGSAENGKGKACKNTRRLCLISEDDLEDVENAQTMILKVPPTSVKKWSGFVNQVAQVMKRPPFAVVTEASIMPNPNTQFELGFKVAEQISDGQVLSALMDKRQLAYQELTQPYQQTEKPKPTDKNAKLGGKRR